MKTSGKKPAQASGPPVEANSTETASFEAQKHASIRELGTRDDLKQAARRWMEAVSRHRYSYNFSWLGLPIIQFPQDMVAIQELIWALKPDLVIETGIAHGGSLIFHASILELIGGAGKVLGIDVDIRRHNRQAIEEHSMSKRITLIEGSSVAESTLGRVRDFARSHSRPMVILDSHHMHEHVLKELLLYSPFVRKGGYLIVLDTAIEDLDEGLFNGRPWGKGNNPKTAVWEFLKSCDRFVIDKDIENKLLITVAPDGYLKCIKD